MPATAVMAVRPLISSACWYLQGDEVATVGKDVAAQETS